MSNKIRDIDVYDERFKKLKIIDFDKLDKESDRIVGLFKKHRPLKFPFPQGIIFTLIDLWFIYALMISPLNGALNNFDNASGLGSFFMALFLMVPYIGFKIYFLRYLRRSYLPKNAPETLFIRMYRSFSKNFVKLALYEKFVMKIGSDLDPHLFEAEYIEDIYSNKASDFFKMALDAKANVITNYSRSEEHHLKRNMTTDSYDDHTVTKFFGIAVRVLKEKDENTNIIKEVIKNDSNLSDELIKLNELKEKGILTEEEFAAAKEKILKKQS